MMAGLVRQAVRSNPWSFLGPASTQCLAAAIVAGALGALASLDDAGLTRAQRGALADSGITDIAAIFVGISVYLSVIIVGVTMVATIARQARDIALVRAVGATPARVRRAIAVQAALVAVPATALGIGLGTLGGRWWIDGLKDHGVVPATVAFHASGIAVPVAFAVTVGTSLLGATIAAIRPSRVRPAVALAASAVPGKRVGMVRTVVGLVLVTGGVVLSVSIAHDPHAADSAFFVMLALCLGAGFLAPALLRVAAPVARLCGDTGALAADSVIVRSKALSGALVPLVLAAAFAVVKVASHTTATHVTGRAEPAADLWTDYSGTAVYTAFAAVAALNTLITVTLARRRDLAVARLAGGTKTRVLSVVICEALIVTVTGLLVATGVAAATLLPMLHATLGTWTPWLPAGYLVAGAAGTLAVVLAGTVLPAALSMRRPAIEAVG